jgi:hypothetical protein
MRKALATANKFVENLPKTANVAVEQDPNQISFKEAVASGKFKYQTAGLYKEADTDTNIGRVWFKKQIPNETTGAMEDWLVAYTTDEEDMMRAIANQELKKIAQTQSVDYYAHLWDAASSFAQKNAHVTPQAIQSYLDPIVSKLCGKKDPKECAHIKQMSSKVVENIMEDVRMGDIKTASFHKSAADKWNIPHVNAKVKSIYNEAVELRKECPHKSSQELFDLLKRAYPEQEYWLRAIVADVFSEVAVKTAAGEKQPKPQDVPLSQGIKSKNITMDETGGGGTAKVTVEFSDPQKGLQFFQDQGGTSGGDKAEETPAPKEDAGAEGNDENAPVGKNALPPQQGQAPQGAPAPAAKPNPNQNFMMSHTTVRQFSKFGQKVVTVLKEVYSAEDDEEEKDGKEKKHKFPFEHKKKDGEDSKSEKKEDKKDDKGEKKDHKWNFEKKDKKESSLAYSFINESGQKINLPWTIDLPIGERFSRPDTGDIVRVAGYKDISYETVDNLVSELAHYAADISDSVKPMSWTNDESKSNTPSGAGQPMAPNQNLQNDNKNNVLYDSNQDEGPQFQTTIDPKQKSVTVKFLDSPEKDALNEAVNTPPAGAAPGANPNLSPGQGQAPAPVQSQAPGNQKGEFGGEQSNPQVQF